VQVIVIAATNRGDLLDPALLRPGRFDRRIIVNYPDLEGRKSILKIHARGKPFAQDVDWEKVAKRTVGFSGADLENMLNEAAIYAARDNRNEINLNDIEEAATKVKLGPEKKRLQSTFDKKITAYHEAGHAIVSHFLPNTDPVHRISIVSRGMALGYTLISPVKDKLHETKTHLQEQIAVMMGGRAAEEIIFNETTTGAANDFDQATKIARAMVIEYGMSELGPINLGPTYDVTEWGKNYLESANISQEMLGKIDNEIKKILNNGYNLAKKIILEKKEFLTKIADELMKKESLDEEEFEKIVGKKTIIN
jgi:cell division protease FtsH